MNNIIEQIKILKKQKGITNEELATLAGTYPANICNILNYKVTPKLDTLIKMLDALEMQLTITDKPVL